MEDWCVLCNKPVESIGSETCPCPEYFAGGALPCAAWRVEPEQASWGDAPPFLNRRLLL